MGFVSGEKGFAGGEKGLFKGRRVLFHRGKGFCGGEKGLGSGKGILGGRRLGWVEYHCEFYVLRCSTFPHDYFFICLFLYVVTFFLFYFEIN